MPRKFRLSVHRKNEFRKKRALQRKSTSETEETVSTESAATCLQQLHQWSKESLKLPQGWVDASLASESHIVFSKLRDENGEMKVLACLRIRDDFSWNVTIDERDTTASFLDKYESCTNLVQSVSSLQTVINYADSCFICVGNNDDKYLSFRDSSFMNAQGDKCLAYYDESKKAIFSQECSVIVMAASKRCMACAKYRSVLNRKLLRAKASSSTSDKCDPSSHVNYHRLNNSEKCERLKRLHQQSRLNQQQVKRLEDRLGKVCNERAVALDTGLDAELREIVTEHDIQIEHSFPKGTFGHIFWNNQKRAMELKDARSMKWDPLMIRWCLYLRHVCGNGYEVLRESGLIKLPCQRTLRDYTYFTKTTVGFSDDVDRQLMESAKINVCEEREKYVVVLMDEMHIKEDVVYDKHTGEVIGFCNLGDINFDIAKLEHVMTNGDVNEEEPKLANSMLVFLIKGLFSNLVFPYVQFPCTALSGDQMYEPFWEVVKRLEFCEFKVLALTCDGLSANRRLFHLHNPHASSHVIVHKVKNPYDPERYLFFLVDPPHLLKTVRNCWANSKRRLWRNGKEILWSHLVNLYYNNRSKTNPGLALIPKLKYEHLNLTSFSKMRVDLAAQVLSKTVAKGLEMMKDDNLSETVLFVDMFDKWFDTLNVCNMTSGKTSRNAFKSPFRSANDFRIHWLENEFLPYLKDWEDSVAERKEFKNSQRNMMLLSSETRRGLQITVMSFIELVRYVFTIPGVKMFLSNRLNQDPIEKFFGQQRQRGGTHNNPNAAQFLKNTQALRVINTTCGPIRGNCRGDKRKALESLENTPLSKRKRKH